MTTQAPGARDPSVRTFVSSRGIYYVVAAVFTLIVAVAIVRTPADAGRRLLAIAIMAVVIYLPVGLMLRRRIDIAGDTLQYRNPFGRVHTVEMNRLQRVEVRRHFRGNTMTYTLLLADTAGGRARFAVTPKRLPLVSIWADEGALFDLVNGYAQTQGVAYDELTAWALRP